MRLTNVQARQALQRHLHGVLCTSHADRGIDAVPVVFALSDDDHLGVPVDLVKPKTTTRLQRERNLEADPSATLLIDHWDRDDWSQLWWVRAHLRWVAHPDATSVVDLTRRLVHRYPQYAGAPFARVLVFRVVDLAGWSAAEVGGPDPQRDVSPVVGPG